MSHSTDKICLQSGQSISIHLFPTRIIIMFIEYSFKYTNGYILFKLYYIKYVICTKSVKVSDKYFISTSSCFPTIGHELMVEIRQNPTNSPLS